MIVGAGFHFAFFRCIVARTVARVIRAIRKHAGSEGNRSPVGGPFLIVRSGRKRSDFLCVPALRGHYVYLRRSLATGEECDGFSIARPLRPGVMPRLRQLARLASWRSRDDPDIVRHAVRVHVGCAHGVDHRAPIRRNLRFADALHRHQVIERHRMLGRILRPRGSRKRNQKKHERLRPGFEMHENPFRGSMRSPRSRTPPRLKSTRYYFLADHSIFSLLVETQGGITNPDWKWVRWTSPRDLAAPFCYFVPIANLQSQRPRLPAERLPRCASCGMPARPRRGSRVRQTNFPPEGERHEHPKAFTAVRGERRR